VTSALGSVATRVSTRTIIKIASMVVCVICRGLKVLTLQTRLSVEKSTLTSKNRQNFIFLITLINFLQEKPSASLPKYPWERSLNRFVRYSSWRMPPNLEAAVSEKALQAPHTRDMRTATFRVLGLASQNRSPECCRMHGFRDNV
jgi:hypothetical protein